jgi:hypothetical protein
LLIAFSFSHLGISSPLEQDFDIISIACYISWLPRHGYGMILLSFRHFI